MEMKPNRRLIVSIGGVVAALAVLVGIYVFIISPRTKAWREDRVEIQKSDKRLAELRILFKDQDGPKVEINVLKQEFKNLGKANASLDKIKKKGMETKDLPKELMDPDPKLRIALINDYMKEVMSVSEENIKQDLVNVQIMAPDFKLYNKIKASPEAAYYMNRANGLQGLVNAITRTKAENGGEIAFAELKLEDYDKGVKRRMASQNVLSYSVEMTMNAQGLMSLMYNLQEEEGYYYISDMTVKPAASGRFSTGASSGGFKLLVDARINTVMIFESQVESALKQAIQKAGGSKKGSGGGVASGWFAAFSMQAQQTADSEAGVKVEKKWYEFWK